MHGTEETVIDRDRQFAGMIEGVREVARKAAERRDEIDAAGKFPAELFDELEASGVFRLCAPKRFGGFEMSIEQMNEVVFEGARGLGSLGWLLMVGASQSIGTGLFPEETVEEMYEDGKDHRSRGVIAPRGVAVPVEGGYVVSGQWPFASGGPSPDSVTGNSVVMEDGKPKIGPSGHPEAILAMMPASEVEFLDTWHVIGMRGTDSCDVRATEVFVPTEKTFSLLAPPESCFDTPVARLPMRVALAFPHSALALGIAQGAIDDIIELGKTKRASMDPTALLGNDVLFRHELGRNTMKLTAAKAMLDQTTAECWQAGTEGRELSPEEILTTRLMANHITSECVEIVDWAYTRGGSSTVYNGSSLQTRFRDIHVATQHASCHTDPYRQLGAVMLGETLSPRELF